MATTTPNFGWSVPTSTDLVKDGATAIETLGDSIDASFVDLKGGTTGQVLAKASGTDLDFSWVAQDDSNAIQNAIVDAKGDLIAATAADTPARLAVGTDGQVLTADSTAATGLKWASSGASGKVLQVVQGTVTSNTSSSSSSYVDVSLSASITPSSATSKVLVLMSGVCYIEASSGTRNLHVQLVRGATSIAEQEPALLSSYNGSTGSLAGGISFSYLDSPATTSATTYKIQACMKDQTSSFIFNYNSSLSSIVLMEIGA